MSSSAKSEMWKVKSRISERVFCGEIGTDLNVDLRSGEGVTTWKQRTLLFKIKWNELN